MVSLERVRRIGAGGLWLAYPLMLYAGLRWGSPRMVGIFLLAMLVLQHRRSAQRMVRHLAALDHAILAFLLLHAATATLADSELAVRLFPVSMNLGMLALFARSLWSEQTMIERIARLSEPDLDPDGIRYTRQVTRVWCGFLALNALIALATAIYCDREAWALYNGLIAYILMGALLIGERIFRTYWQRQRR